MEYRSFCLTLVTEGPAGKTHTLELDVTDAGQVEQLADSFHLPVSMNRGRSSRLPHPQRYVVTSE